MQRQSWLAIAYATCWCSASPLGMGLAPVKGASPLREYVAYCTDSVHSIVNNALGAAGLNLEFRGYDDFP
jgi:hypothetical protein